MAGEKETTGLYLSGHPMDAYRPMLKNAHVASIGDIMTSFAEGADRYQDEQVVTVAGVIQSIRTRPTRNGSLMAYIVLEDDTAAMEMLAFSSILRRYDSFLKENQPVMITGKLTVRDEKDPQLMVDRARLLLDSEEPIPLPGSTVPVTDCAGPAALSAGGQAGQPRFPQDPGDFEPIPGADAGDPGGGGYRQALRHKVRSGARNAPGAAPGAGREKCCNKIASGGENACKLCYNLL